MVHFTPWASLAGGLALGLAAALLWLCNGRVAGVSGIAAGLLWPEEGDESWRACFVGGLVLGGVALAFRWHGATIDALPRSAGALVVGGLCVGVGSRLANGCTSGHGLCGLARLSPRSFAAVLSFMTTGAVTVWAIRSLAGGAL